MLPVRTMRATTSATLTPEAKVRASIGMAVSRFKAIFNSFIDTVCVFDLLLGLLIGLRHSILGLRRRSEKISRPQPRKPFLPGWSGGRRRLGLQTIVPMGHEEFFIFGQKGAGFS